MSSVRWLVGIAFVALVIPSLGAQEKSTIKWKFEKEKTFYQKVVTKTVQKMKVTGTDINQEQNQTFFFSWTPVKQDGDNWELKQKIEGVILNIDIGGTKVQHDSTKESTSTTPLSDFFKALVGTEFLVTINTKDMKVTKIAGREEFVKKLVNSNPQMQPLLDKILSEKTMVEMAEEGNGLTLFRAIESWLERAPFVSVGEWSFLTECVGISSSFFEAVRSDFAQVPPSCRSICLASSGVFQGCLSRRCRCFAGRTRSYRERTSRNSAAAFA